MNDIYSNAFNFSSSLTGSMDIRTGQYNAQIHLATLNPVSETSLKRDILLSFSMLNQTNSGFGMGWSISGCCQLDTLASPDTLTLADGTRYQSATDRYLPGNIVSFSDQKINNVVVKCIDATTLKIYSINGTTETLYRPNTDVPYQTQTYTLESGENFTFSYWHAQKLKSITDSQGVEVFSIDYDSAGVALSAKVKGDQGKYACISFTQINGLLTKVTQPYDSLGAKETHGTKFEYKSLSPKSATSQEYFAISKITSPLGGVEEIDYISSGFTLDSDNSIPVVSLISERAGCQQPEVIKKYRYSVNNFTGYNADTRYHFGQENIYLSQRPYDYWTCEEIYGIDEPDVCLKSVTYNHNKYHLLTNVTTLCDDTCLQHITQYNEQFDQQGNSLPFAQQPANLQFPSVVKTVVSYLSQPELSREFTEIHETNEYGNLCSQTGVDGITTHYDYYPRQGEERCPADPSGFFERFMRSQTLSAADGLQKTRDYTYQSMPVEHPDHNYMVVPQSETTTDCVAYDNETITTQIRVDYCPDSENALPCLRGKLKEKISSVTKTSTLATDSVTHTTREIYDYLIADGVLVTDQTLIGFDQCQLKTSESQSVYTGLTLSQTNRLGVCDQTDYDALGRKIAFRSAVGSAYMQTESYQYLLPPEVDAPRMALTDSHGVMSHFIYDGKGRILQGEEQAENQLFYQTRACHYNILGQLTDDIRYDYHSDGTLFATKSQAFIYDGWGARCETHHSDGIIDIQKVDPLNLQLTQQKIRRDNSENPLQVTAQLSAKRTTLNLFKQPERVEDLTIDGLTYATHAYKFDGFGRKTKIVSPLNRTLSVHCYDAFDRAIFMTDAGNNNFQIDYAPFTASPLMTAITLLGTTPTVLGSQIFDGLGRIVDSTTDSITVQYSYAGGGVRPTALSKNDGSLIEFSYLAELDEKPLKVTAYQDGDRTTGELLSAFTYAKQQDAGCAIGTLLQATNNNATYDYQYHADGKIKHINQNVAGFPSAQTQLTQQTLAGVPISADMMLATGEMSTRKLAYDAEGRLLSSVQQGSTANTEYDPFGRPMCETISEGDNVHQITTFAYDEFSREISRCITHANETVTLSNVYDVENRIIEKTTVHGGVGTLIESFHYDLQGRLEIYDTHAGAPQEMLPRNEQNLPLVRQTFSYDELSNIRCCTSVFADGREDTASYTYHGRQLTTISHTMTSGDRAYPAQVSVTYNANGEIKTITSGDKTRELDYSATGRLRQCGDSHYAYDPYERWVIGDEKARYYSGDSVLFDHDGKTVYRYLRHAGKSYAEQSQEQMLILGCNYSGAVTTSFPVGSPTLSCSTYSPYGESSGISRSGFNGELRDPQTGGYFLGNGARVYLPELGQFLSADIRSPFSGGGINPYLYCQGDPVNLLDPSGFVSMEKLTRDYNGVISSAIGLFMVFFKPVGPIIKLISIGLAVISLIGAVVALAGDGKGDSKMNTIGSWLSSVAGLSNALLGLGTLAYGKLRPAKGSGSSASSRRTSALPDEEIDEAVPENTGNRRRSRTHSDSDSDQQRRATETQRVRQRRADDIDITQDSSFGTQESVTASNRLFTGRQGPGGTSLRRATSLPSVLPASDPMSSGRNVSINNVLSGHNREQLPTLTGNAPGTASPETGTSAHSNVLLRMGIPPSSSD